MIKASWVVILLKILSIQFEVKWVIHVIIKEDAYARFSIFKWLR